MIFGMSLERPIASSKVLERHTPNFGLGNFSVENSVFPTLGQLGFPSLTYRRGHVFDCVNHFRPPALKMDSQLSIFNAEINASCGISTFPNCRIFFFPAFCFSSSFFFRVASPP